MNTLFTKAKSFIICAALIAAAAFSVTGCGTSEVSPPAPVETTASVAADSTVLGEGSVQFALTVADRDGSETNFEIHTDKETVGEALSELGLIDGEEGAYGLYVKTVNGITADYDKDGVYWAFYVNGEYASSGIDLTPVEDGASYSLRIE